jgi:hypothetical protein
MDHKNHGGMVFCKRNDELLWSQGPAQKVFLAATTAHYLYSDGRGPWSKGQVPLERKNGAIKKRVLNNGIL